MSRILVFLLVSLGVVGVANAQSAKVDMVLSPAGSFSASTSKVKGHAIVTPEGVIAKDIEVDLTSLNSEIALRDQHMKERLETEKHPRARLVQAKGSNGKGKAIIEIKGKRIPVEGTYEISGNTLKAKFPIDMTKQLDIKDIRYMGVGVKDTVTVNVEVPIQKASERVPASAGRK